MAAVSVTTSIKDMGLDRALDNAVKLDGRFVKVGIQAGSGAHDGVDLVDIAIYNHFGTRNIPARPFVADCADKNRSQIQEAQKRIAYRVMEGMSPDSGLAQLGEWYQNILKAHIRNGGWAANAPSTIRKKKSSRPLVDTGALVNAVRWTKK